jgi:hypothetical protein
VNETTVTPTELEIRVDNSRNTATGESQGGTITAANRQGGGAKFTLTLRRAGLNDGANGANSISRTHA